jgi:hypothetical protein
MNLIAKKTIAILILLFAFMFFCRFISGFFHKFEGTINESNSRQTFGWGRLSEISYKKDVSSNMDKIAFSQRAYPEVGINLVEVFAKEARMRTLTANFEADENICRSAVNRHEALIRIEKMEGLKPDRILQLVIRVPESKFDGLTKDLRNIGKINSFQVSKEDKSEEVKKLLVEKNSLNEYKNSLVSLRKAAGKVEEFLNLEGKIQEIQKKLEELDANIGGFSGKESFNNISFDLAENINFYVDPNAYPLSSRIVDALLWTVQYYFLILLLFAVIGALAWSGQMIFVRKEN